VLLAVLATAEPAAAQDRERAGSAPAATRLSRDDVRAFAARAADRQPHGDRAPPAGGRYPDLTTQNFRRSGDKLELVYVSPRANRELAAISVDLAKREATGEWDRRPHRLDAGARARRAVRRRPRPRNWWFWLPLAVLFLAPFVDRAGTFRLLHVDPAGAAGLRPLAPVLQRGQPRRLGPAHLSGARIPPRAHAAGRLRARRLSAPLVPYARTSWLVGGIAVLAVARIVVDWLEHNVLDVGYAGCDRRRPHRPRRGRVRPPASTDDPPTATPTDR